MKQKLSKEELEKRLWELGMEARKSHAEALSANS